MKKRQLLTMTCVFGLTMLIILFLAVAVFIDSMQKNKAISPEIQTEYVYVYVPETGKEESSETEPTSELIGWTLKEHQGQIGIFQKDGTLIRVIETYVKTLPEADRSMLEEGIYADTEQALRSLIEDYSD